MNAGANSINQAGVGMVYLANVLPSLSVKLTGPYWFDYVSYRLRMVSIALLMVLCLLVVAWAESPYEKLLGVALSSLACGMGEASLLAMSSFYDAQVCLTAWSSGTGFSGIAGYLWSLLFDYLELCFQVQLMVALWIPLAWLLTFFLLLGVPWIDRARHDSPHHCAERISNKQRFRYIFKLWPYTVPLFWVYAAEYLIQSGFWAAMGFPVTDPIQRRRWYKASNFTYQIGVFISRSAFRCICRRRKVLWLGSLLQVFFAIFFAAAALRPFGDWWLLAPALFVGFLGGGGVYVGAFTLIALEQPAAYVELALSSASVADTLGMILASGLGFLVQGCIFGQRHVVDTVPDFTCGYSIWEATSTVRAVSVAKYCFPGVQG